MFLLGAVIVRAAGNSKTKLVVVEREAFVRVADDDGCVINAEEKFISGLPPLRITLPRRKPDDFQHMVLRVTKIERLDSAGVLVPVWQRLRRGRDVLYLVLEQSRVSFVHVAHDNRDVLKPAVETSRVLWDGSAFLSKVIRQRDVFTAKFEQRHAHFYIS